MKKTVLNMLRDGVNNYPNTHYTSNKKNDIWDSMTYTKVLEESRFIASGLIEMGIKKDDKLALISEGKNIWICMEFGMLFAGATNVPLALKLLPEEILFRIKHSESKVVVVSKMMLKGIAPLYSKMQKGMKLIILEDSIDGMEEILKEYGIIYGEHCFLYGDILQSGKETWEKNIKKLEKREEEIEEDDIVTISYTSGTTGDPKGIMLTHLNYYHNCHDAMEYFNLDPGQRLYICIPIDHSFAHTVGIYAALLIGISIFFVDFGGGGIQYAKNVAKNLKEANPHFMLSVPSLSSNFMMKIKDGVREKGKFVHAIFNMGLNAGIRMNRDGYHKAGFFVKLINYLPHKLADVLVFSKVRQIFGNNIEFIVGGGALLDIRQQHFFYAIGAPVFQGYGLSEATPIISANTREIHKMGSSGRVIPNVECKIINDRGEEVKTGEQGQIIIKGNNVMKGYYKNPETTSKTIIDGWLYTGDLGYLDDDGFLIVIGREKALLISADGEKYSPEGIEEAIQNSGFLIHQVMVYNDMKKTTTAIITLHKEKVRAYAKKQGFTREEQILEAIKKDLYKFKEIPEFKGQFLEKWIPTTFQIAPEEFSDKNQMINSALKMVRHKIQETYQDRIDFMYSPGGSNIINEMNIQAVSELLR
jgi:long-chain acyl-CoA synthetase